MKQFTESEINDKVNERLRWFRQKSKDKAENRKKANNEYLRLCKARSNGRGLVPLGSPEELQIREEIKERFNLTDKQLQNTLDNKDKYLNIREQGFTSQLIMGHYVTLISAANEAIQGLDEYVEHINREIDSGRDFIDIEKYASSKGSGIKGLTPREALRSVLREKVDIVRESFEPLKALAPKVVQIQDSTPQFDSLEELRKQREVLKKQLKIEEGENEED